MRDEHATFFGLVEHGKTVIADIDHLTMDRSVIFKNVDAESVGIAVPRSQGQRHYRHLCNPNGKSSLHRYSPYLSTLPNRLYLRQAKWAMSGIQVWMKLVDRKSGNVLARALTIRGPRRVTGYATPFEADAVEYKETVHVLGGAAMREALSFLCLMPCN